MITKDEALEIAKKYLEHKRRKYTTINNNVTFEENERILHGSKEGQKDDIYTVNYGKMWGSNEKSIFIHISVNTGEVLYTLGRNGCIEDIED